MTYTVAFSTICSKCSTQATLVAFGSTKPPATEKLGTEGADSKCFNCDEPLRLRLVGVTLSGFTVVPDDDDE